MIKNGVYKPYGENPSCLQTTEAPLEFHDLLQTDPHDALTHTSTRPILSLELPLRRISLSMQGTA